MSFVFFFYDQFIVDVLFECPVQLILDKCYSCICRKYRIVLSERKVKLREIVMTVGSQKNGRILHDIFKKKNLSIWVLRLLTVDQNAAVVH